MSSYIAALDIAQNPLPRRSGWKALAAEVELEVRQFAGPPGFEAHEEYIAGATGLWLYNSCYLRDSAFERLIHEAIDRGQRCFVEISVNELTRVNKFLEPYGLVGTTMGICQSAPTEGVHPRLISIDRRTYPGAFRDPVLFESVESVLLNGPQVLLCTANANPILTVPLSTNMVVDLRTDLLEVFDTTAVSVMGLGGDAGSVLATSNRLFHDACVGITRFSFVGIEGNARLAKNVLRWLAGDGSSNAGEEDAAEAFRILDGVERTIAKYLRSVLSRVTSDWWTNGVPEKIRVICA